MITITKEQFEDIMSVATSSQMQVYEKVSPSLTTTAAMVETSILGDAGKAAMETNAEVKDSALTYICIYAFLSIFRQLDLVLTPTGFGVVSNNTVAPASKERVDRLEEQLYLTGERAKGRLLAALTAVDGWGDSVQARLNIETPAFNFNRYEQRRVRLKSIDEWSSARMTARDVALRLRELMGNEQWEAIMKRVRNDITKAPAAIGIAAEIITDIMFLQSLRQRVPVEKQHYLLNFMEQHPDDFEAYMNSNEYKVNHYERFRNTQQDKAFQFVG